MYINFDYRCSPCETREPRFIKKEKKDEQTCNCGAPMCRLPAAPKTTFRFADRRLKP